MHILNGNATYIRCFGFPHLTSINNHPPRALAVNSEEKLYLADDRNHCVYVLSSTGPVGSISSNLARMVLLVKEVP